MWPPPNIQSLPSKEEIKNVREEIKTIELEIIETELRLDALRKSLSERKVWIAPIRTIPPEILSPIFIEASRTDWKTPLVLQSVSRRWHQVVLDSPKAWTFIPLSKYITECRSELISLFLERGRNRPLHISVKDNHSLLRYMELLADRIECISLDISMELLNRHVQRGRTFHRLERLKIWHRDSSEDASADGPAAWDMLLFPKLKVLEIRTLSSHLLRVISAAPEFPAIQHLTLRCGNYQRLPEILTKCATSLESAELVYFHRPSVGLDREYNIHFPRLRYLRLVDLSREAGPSLRFNATTPNLQAYLVYGDISTFNTVKVDTGDVTFLQVSSTPDLSRYPRLVTLCFSRDTREQEEVTKATEYLRDNPSLCPDLALIEHTAQLTEDQTAHVKGVLMARGEANGHVVQLARGALNMQEERAQALKGIETCGDYMPCNFSY